MEKLSYAKGKLVETQGRKAKGVSRYKTLNTGYQPAARG